MYLSSFKLAIVNGSANSESMTRNVARLLEIEASQFHNSVTLVDDIAARLPPYGCDEHSSTINRWKTTIQQAAGILFVTPDYHGSYSGVLKNMLDWLERIDIEGKPVGLVAVPGSARGGFTSLDALRLVLRNLHAHVVFEQMIVLKSDLNPHSGEFSDLTKKRVAQLFNVLTREINLHGDSLPVCS